MTPPSIHQYRVLRKLGEGGMGEVYLADDTRLHRQVAIKLLPADVVGDDDRRHRFMTEARAASALNHPNVCVIHDFGETDDGRPFIVMELLEGQPLHELAAHGALEIVRIVEIALQIADALDVAHAKGVVHRDIKPANISVNARGQVKVLDFGLAKRLATPEQVDQHGPTASLETRAGTVLGTPSYMSPEQALGRPVDHRTDLFSLGVVIYELVTGQSAFAGITLGETLNNIVHVQPAAMPRFNYDLPPELERIALKCLQKSPERRYQSARELLVDLKNLLRELDAGLSGIREAPSVAEAAPARQTSIAARPSAAAPPAASPPPAEQVKQSDIFISCAQIDDQPLWPETEGWISHFQRNLKIRLEQLLGEPVNVSSYPMTSQPASAHDTLLQVIPSAKTLVSVLSPPFTKSEGCRRTVEQFWQAAESSGRLRVDNRSRLLKVVKTPVSPDDVPIELARTFSQVLSFEFYEQDPATGRVREFDERFGPEARQRYFERVYDVAQEIYRVLTAIKQDRSRDVQPHDRAAGKIVFLAASSSDLQHEVDKIRRELIARGHEVLPDRPLPLVGSELEAAVRECLDRSHLAIHPIGDIYGMIPEGSDYSIVELQNRIAASHATASPLPRLIWLPRELTPRDARQEAFLRALRTDPDLHHGAEIVQDHLETLKGIVVDRLTPPRAPVVATGAAGQPSARRVYLICDKNDEAAVEPIEDYLFEQGMEVSMPDFEADEAEAGEVHRQHLLDCDAVLIFYGSARHSWVDIKLRSILKANGYGREADFAAQAVYIAPPFDRRKERFRSHTAEVIRQTDRFEPDLLKPFMRQVSQSRGSEHE